MLTIKAPTHCPACEVELVWVNHLLYCKNSDCISQVEKRIEHFAKTLKIKGLGPSTIAKLNLSSFDELYDLSREYIAEAISSDRIAEKLVAEIDASKNVNLNRLLPAFSIRLIGQTAANKLSFVCNHITDINEDTCLQAGLGPKATTNMMRWMNTVYPSIAALPFSFTFKKKTIIANKSICVCMTGKLNSYKTKAIAAEALEGAGYTVKQNLTKEVTILVSENAVESAKTKKARLSGITIVTDLKQFLEGELNE